MLNVAQFGLATGKTGGKLKMVEQMIEMSGHNPMLTLKSCHLASYLSEINLEVLQTFTTSFIFLRQSK